MTFYTQKNRREQPPLKFEVHFLNYVIFLKYFIWYQDLTDQNSMRSHVQSGLHSGYRDMDF